jgi:hypothetical protein
MQDEEQIVTECRVRYLSFLGIGKDVKQCAFIMHTAQDLFIAHVFHCEPSSGALCKTIEAACKVGSFTPDPNLFCACPHYTDQILISVFKESAINY